MERLESVGKVRTIVAQGLDLTLASKSRRVRLTSTYWEPEVEIWRRK